MKQLSELTEPIKVVRKLLEKDIQAACVTWVRARGVWARKFSSPSNRSVPDYLFAGITRDGWPFKIAVEFKAPGKTSTKAQLEEQDAMRVAGWDVHEFDNVEAFKRYFADYVATV